MDEKMNTFPQSVVAHAGQNVIVIVYKIKDVENAEEKIKDFCGNFSAYMRSMRNRFPDSEFSSTIGFGAKVWKRLFSDLGIPKELTEFEPIAGQKYVAVSTEGDIIFHIRSRQMGYCHEFATIIEMKIGDVVEAVDETHGFRYMDGKAIIGFVDGTENPTVDLNPYDFAMIGDEDPNFIGGSYLFVQKYIHDMSGWNKLPVEEQEKVIGRHKFNDVELTDEEKPINAHNKVTNIEDENGNELKIVRANIPFANTSTHEYGTYFISYARYFSTTRKMLENMFIGDPIGNTDRLLDYSTAVTGTLFFTPSYDLLGTMGGE